MKKYIIELEEGSQIFGLLLVNTNKQGVLRYYQANAEGTELTEPDYEGVYKQLFDSILFKATTICNDNYFNLMTY